MTDTPSDKKTPLNCNRDPQRWADEFNDVLVARGEQPMDPGWLISWFANAIMCGEDTYRWRKEAEARSSTGATEQEPCAWRWKDKFEDMHGNGPWHYAQLAPAQYGGNQDAVKIEPLYPMKWETRSATLPPKHEAFEILRALSREYGRDQQCDGRKINSLIERGETLLRRTFPPERKSP